MGEPGDDPFTDVLIGFTHELRSAGLTVGTGDVLTYFAAMTPLDPTDLIDLYWAGKTTLLTRHEDHAVYDRVFRQYFLGEESPARTMLMIQPRSALEAEAALVLPATEPGSEEDQQERQALGWMASDVDAVKHRSFTECTPEELAALRRIMTRMRLTPPRRRTRRTRTAKAGTDPDIRAIIRESMRRLGEPSELYLRERKNKPRPLILILDVSGSMADYSRQLLLFAHTARRSSARVEVFCFGTRLTRITKELAHQRPDAALAQAARTVVDWEGGTRIGASLDTFVRKWARGGLCRGGVVVICSDGLDRGDPEVLATAMERLARLCHRIVWLNPHKGDNRDFQPSTLGMMVAAPHIDLLLSGHDLASLEELAGTLPALN
ncbi:VWA domain-containing protein [Trebonia kvetii]|uniref:VWA domain-containing protein n=1 Tax=Trebonia kvetii TaxID=2480626 RepID=A0A6P2C6E0_9ACTN|nr:VWA domain-containing protein [Trebonia kvetii]TVZ06848.1 VWA domain-containing protein [Trebonia kvetii]